MTHEIHQTREYLLVSRFYGERKARRSGLELIRHIDQGLKILAAIGASEGALRAFCIHPLVQEDNALTQSLSDVCELDARVVAFAMEYRSFANGYLAKHPSRSPSEIALSPLREVNDMLVADKVQNYHDFRLHNASHPNARRLKEYFSQWLTRLGVDDNRLNELEKLLD